MSALLDRARARASAAAGREEARPLTIVATAAALWAATAGLAICVGVAVVGWVIGSTGTVVDAARVGAQAWLLGQGSGLQADGVTVTAVPLGLTMLSAFVLLRTSARAAAQAGANDARSVVAGAAVVSSVYAVIALALALLTAGPDTAVSPTRAFATAFLVAGLASGGGMLRGADLLAPTWQRVPEHARAALHGGAAGTLATASAGALLVTVALTADFGEAANVAQATGAGVVGGLILTAAGVLLLPNAVLLAVAYALGPGFVLGSGTSVTPGAVTLGRVPAFPLLAALPDEGVGPWWAAALLALPVLAGALAAAVALRHHPVDRLDRAALRGGSAGLLAGLTTGLATGLAGGSAGPGRLADVGARWLACVGSASVAMTLGGAATALLLLWWSRRRSR